MRFARALKGAVELATLTAAFVLAYLLRFDFAPDPTDAARLWYALPIAVAAKELALWYFRLLCNWWWRYVGIPDVLRIGRAATLADAVAFYDSRFGIGFTAQEKDDLVAFLQSL